MIADQVHFPLRNKLFTSYKVMKQQLGEVKLGTLVEPHAAIIAGRMSSLFKSVEGACAKLSRPVGTLEAESRHKWDALLANFYVASEQENFSAHIMYVM